MMGGLRAWLLSLICAAVLCALARALMPPGAVKRVGGLVCSLVLLAAVLSPAVELSPQAAQAWLAQLTDGQAQREAELHQQLEDGIKPIIEQEFAAYIVDKAAEWGLAVTARVECAASEGGLYLPHRTWVSGPLPQEARARLTGLIQSDLGVPEERQAYDNGEGVP